MTTETKCCFLECSSTYQAMEILAATDPLHARIKELDSELKTFKLNYANEVAAELEQQISQFEEDINAELGNNVVAEKLRKYLSLVRDKLAKMVAHAKETYK